MSRRISPPRGYRMPERASTGGGFPPNSYDPYGSRARDRYTSPRTSGDRVGGGGTTTLASVEKYDAYGRKISTSGAQPYSNPRSSNPSVSGAPSRRLSVNAPPSRGYDPYHRPSVSHAQPSSARAPEPYTRAPYNPIPASNAARSSHRQSSSIDDVLRSSASARRDVGSDQQRPRRDSNDRHPRDSRGYHTVGPKPPARSDDRAYEYGSSRDRYANSGAPRRHERSASIDTEPRERPKSMMIDYPGYDKPPREAGPPPTTRGLDRINGGVGRSSSVRDQQVRSPVRTADRGRRGSSSEREHDDYYVAPRRQRPQSEYEPRPAVASPPRQRLEDHRSSRPALRLEDPDVDKRGFGLRSPSPDATEKGFDRSRMIPAGTIEARGRGPSPSAPGYGRPAPPRDSQEDHDRRAADRKRDRVEDRSSAYEENRGPPPGRSVRPEPNGRERRSEAGSGSFPYHHANTDISKTLDAGHGTLAATAVGGGAAALAAAEHARRHENGEDSDDGRKREPTYDVQTQNHAPPSQREEPTSTRGNANRGAPRRSSDEISERSVPGDEEDDYELRLRQEMQRKAQARAGAGAHAGPQPPSRQHAPARNDYSPPRAPRERNYGDDELVDYGGHHRDASPPNENGDQALSRYQPPEVENYTQDKLSAEPEDPSERPTSPTTTTSSSAKRVAIVEPPAEVLKPKGILKKPKDNWPEYPPEPMPIAAPPKGKIVKGAPEDARTSRLKIDDVSTRILDHYGERYVLIEGPNGEEMAEVLRVLSKKRAVSYRDKSTILRGK